MTRRERLTRIVQYMGVARVRWEAALLCDRLTQGNLDDLSDEGAERLVRSLVQSWRREQRMTRENRARYGRQKAAPQ